jgi:hypothetical protein
MIIGSMKRAHSVLDQALAGFGGAAAAVDPGADMGCEKIARFATVVAGSCELLSASRGGGIVFGVMVERGCVVKLRRGRARAAYARFAAARFSVSIAAIPSSRVA